VLIALQNFWNHPRYRQYLYQILFFSVLAAIIGYLYHNVVLNLERQNIASGFGFLKQEAGFFISETMIEFWSEDSYLKAIYVGILNTIKVSAIGNILALSLGILIALANRSSNWLLKKMGTMYIDLFRNIPLLLQLFFWYGLFTEVLPDIQEAINPLPGVYFSQRGFYFPVFEPHFIWKYVAISFFASLFLVLKFKRLWFFVLPPIVWLIGGAPLAVSVPELSGFNFSGGYNFSPEFTALLFGLVLYTAAFIAEIVRAGIESVGKGQWEAAASLGLNRSQTMKLVIFPQALRVILPPVTSQFLNLTKNSSLAVGIGYADFVSIMNTVMNQTGQAIESVLIIMAVYLFFSLMTSFVINFYNSRMEKREGRL
jgi:general L-amino acid transport system permease protein